VRVGHLVAMTAAAGGPTGLEARTLDVRYAVAGPVERVEGTGAVVMGQRVDVANAEGREVLHPGAWVAVSGLRRPDGAIAAGRVDGWNAVNGWLLRGRLDAVTPATVTVAGVTLSRSGLDAAMPPVGSAVRVSGRVEAGALALAVAPDPFNPFGAAVGALSVVTVVEAAGRPAGQDAPAAGAAAGTRVVIDSVVESGGGLRGSRAFGAPALGGTAAPGADPSARAVGLAREGARRDGPPGIGPSGVGPSGIGMPGARAPEGMGAPDADPPKGDDARGWGRSPDGIGRSADGLGGSPGLSRSDATGAPDGGFGGSPRGGVRGGPSGPPGGGPPGGGPPGGGPPGGARGGAGSRGGATR